MPLKPFQKGLQVTQTQTQGRLKPFVPVKRAPAPRTDIRQSDNYKNAVSNANKYQQEAQKASSFRGTAVNTLKGLIPGQGTYSKIGSQAVNHPVDTAKSVVSGVYQGGIRPIQEFGAKVRPSNWFNPEKKAQELSLINSIGNYTPKTQTGSDIQQGFNFSGQTIPYTLGGEIAGATTLAQTAPRLANYAVWMGTSQALSDKPITDVQGRGKQALMDTLLFALTGGLRKKSGLPQDVVQNASNALPDAPLKPFVSKIEGVAGKLSSRGKISSSVKVKTIRQPDPLNLKLSQNLQKNTKDVSKAIDDVVKQEADEMIGIYKNAEGVTMLNTGYDSQPGAGTFQRVSDNPTWYRQFYKENGRAPGKKEIYEMAKKNLENGRGQFQDEFNRIASVGKSIQRKVDQINPQKSIDKVNALIQSGQEYTSPKTAELKFKGTESAKIPVAFSREARTAPEKKMLNDKQIVNDFYNQATGGTPLLQEARKYKSAEEFVKGIKKEVPIVENRFMQMDFTRTKDSLPPVETGYIRLYRAEGGRKSYDAVFRKTNISKLPKSFVEGDSKFYTPKLVDANVYAKEYGAKIHYIDVPNSLAQKINPSEYIVNKSQLTDIFNQATGGVEVPTQKIPKGIQQPVGDQMAGDVSNIQRVPEVARTPQSQQLAKSQTVSQRVGQDVSLERIVSQTGTDVKNKVNILDIWRTPDRVLEKIGLKKEGDLLRAQHEKYIAELPKEIEKIDVWAKQLTPESNQKVFRFLDGEKMQLTPQETKIAGEVKTYLKDWADRLGLPEDKRITNYITHIFEKDFIQKEFPDELARIINDKVAGSVYDPFTLKRLGKLGYVPDVVRALDAYAKRAVRKVHMDVALEQVKKSAKNLELSQFEYVKNQIDRINLRPTKVDNAFDNAIKSVIGYKLGARPTTTITRATRQWIYRGTLGLNLASALKNLSQGANTYSKLGEKYTAIGYINLIKNWRSGELEKVGVLQDSFIQDRSLSAGKKFLQKFDEGLMTFFQGAEKINRGAAYYGGKAKGLSEGMSEKQAIEYAKKLVRDTQFTFGSIDTPAILQSDIGKTIGQFQSFTIKQGEFLGEMVAKKDVAGLIRYALASTVYITAIGSAFGMKPQDAIPSFRFGIPPSIAPLVQGAKALMGAPNQYGQPTGSKELLKTLVPFVPAGTQIKKTWEGYQTNQQGYSENDKGNVQFLAPQDTMGQLKALLFGKYQSDEARNYFDGGSILGEKDSTALKALPPEEQKAYFDSVMARRAEDKRKAEVHKQQKELILQGKIEEARKLDPEYLKRNLKRIMKEGGKVTMKDQSLYQSLSMLKTNPFYA